MRSANQSTKPEEGPINYADVMNSESVRQVIETMLNGFIDDPKDKETLLTIANEITNGKTLAQGFGLTDQHLDTVAALAALQYDAGRIIEAMKLYAFIASINQFDVRAMKGLARCHRKLGIFKEALRYSGLSLLLNPEDMDSVLTSAECLYQLGMNDEALKIVQQLLDRKSDPAAQIHKFPEILNRTTDLKNLIVNRSQAS